MSFDPGTLMAIFSAVGTMAGAAGQLKQGKEARAIAESEALQLEDRAQMSRAIGSRQAERVRKASERIRARQQSLLAASGFSASDAGSIAIDAATVKESSISEMLAVAQAEDEARQDEERARITRKAGKSAKQASYLAAGRTLIEGAVSWRERYGTPAPSFGPA